MPSVMMNGDTPNQATPTPLTQPSTAAAPGRHRTPQHGEAASSVPLPPANAPSPCEPTTEVMASDSADRKIEAAGDQGQHLPQRHQDQIDRLAQQIQKVLLTEKVGRQVGKNDQRNDHQEGQHAEALEQPLEQRQRSCPGGTSRRFRLTTGGSSCGLLFGFEEVRKHVGLRDFPPCSSAATRPCHIT